MESESDPFFEKQISDFRNYSHQTVGSPFEFEKIREELGASLGTFFSLIWA